jgi:hypothetical protein
MSDSKWASLVPAPLVYPKVPASSPHMPSKWTSLVPAPLVYPIVPAPSPYMPSKWLVTLSMDQKTRDSYFVNSTDIHEETKEFRVNKRDYTVKHGLGAVLEQKDVESAIGWKIPEDINRVILSTQAHITFFERGAVAVSKPRFISPFNAKKKRVVKSKSKSKYRRKSRSPRRV